MFTIGDKNYHLHYTEQRLEMIEARTGKSVVSDFINTNGALQLATIKAHFAYALICDDDNPDVYVAPKTGMELASQYMKEHGYAAACDAIASQVQADLGFLFRAG